MTGHGGAGRGAPSAGHLELLRVLEYRGPLTRPELAEATGKTVYAIADRVSRALARGWITEAGTAGKRNAARFTLTRAGTETLAAADSDPTLTAGDDTTTVAVPAGAPIGYGDHPDNDRRGISSAGPLTLGQLRELIGRTADWPADSVIGPEVHEGPALMVYRAPDPTPGCRRATIWPIPYKGIGGHTRYRANCITCDVVCSGWTPEGAVAEFEAHRDIPAPPDDVLAGPLTPAVFAEYCEYFQRGRGRPRASTTRCEHGSILTDSPCPSCDQESEDADAGELRDYVSGLQEVIGE